MDIVIIACMMIMFVILVLQPPLREDTIRDIEKAYYKEGYKDALESLIVYMLTKHNYALDLDDFKCFVESESNEDNEN